VPLLTLVIPALNEAIRIADGARRVLPVLEEIGYENVEVVVVDDGSTDDTLRVAGRAYGHLPHTLFVRSDRNQGKGAAVRLGIGVATGNAVIVADADMAISPKGFPHLLSALENADFAPGDRTREGRIQYETTIRTLSGMAFHQLVKHYTGNAHRDTQCGCKAFRLGAARLLALLGLIERFAYDVEMFYLAQLLELRVQPVPVEWQDIRGSSVRVSSDSWQMLSDIRHLRTTKFENPAIVLEPHASLDDISRLTRQARIQGLVVARDATSDIVVFPRNGALAGVEVAQELGGQFRTVSVDELRDREYIPVL
jgi:dolichyl-phosphate beta-glucosyltransferase